MRLAFRGEIRNGMRTRYKLELCSAECCRDMTFFVAMSRRKNLRGEGRGEGRRAVVHAGL
jgi:hypothetical protein